MSIEQHSPSRGRWIARAGTLTAAVFAATAVHAQVTQPNDPGVMTFPNVRVINMTPATVKPMPGADSNAGMRAYLDPETGALTENPTAAHLEDLDAAAANSRSLTKSFRVPAPAFRANGKAVGARLDESHLMYAMARRADDGDVVWACVPGSAKALEFLSGSGEAAPHVHSTPVPGTPTK